MDLEHSATPEPCPHCGKPLEVLWEVYRPWNVVRFQDALLLDADHLEFEGGKCEECGEWVEPSDLQRRS